MPRVPTHNSLLDVKSCYVGKVDKAYDRVLLRGAWLLLLSRYSGGGTLEVRDTSSAETFELAATVDMEIFVFLDQVRKTMAGETCLTSGPMHMFPLANRCLRGGNINFKTVMTHRCTDLADLHDCHIALEIGEETVTISVDESLSSSKHDPGLPERLAGQFQTTIAQLQNATRSSTIGMIDVMGSADWEDAASLELPFPAVTRKTLHSMMRENSLPDSLAIDAWDGRLTYAELDEWSNIVAHKLRHVGVCRGSYVPLFFEKSMWHPVSIFACSKIGAPWVTIPFDMPAGRVRSIINQLKDKNGQTSRVCLSSNGQREKAAEYVQEVIEVASHMVRTTTKDLNSDSTVLPLEDVDNQVLSPIDPDDCAYVCFTSGTTGAPKGIAISQEGICTFIPAWLKLRGYPGGVGIREGHILPYTGDMSMLEILVGVCTGSCLCILSEDERMNDLGPALARYDVTNLHTTPSISEILDPAELSSLKHIHFGGESMTRALMERWLPKVDVLVTYGPAEITNECSGMRVLSAADFGNGCIGKPFGARIYIVAPENPHRRLPRGFVGEIIVEGPGVSAGYISQLETEAFLEDLAWAPASGGIKRRFYRTGDLGYMDADGVFFCEGRKDSQVKIRGQRIEVAEVERLISTIMPEGTRVVVDAVVLRTGTQSLVAFLQLGKAPSANQDEIIESLKTHLLSHLPRAFVPSSFFFVDHIPLGTTGKVDRKRLKAMIETDVSKHSNNGTLTSVPSSGQNGSGAPDKIHHVDPEVVEPSLEDVLRNLWASVLHLDVENVHPDSHFFKLGGDSINAMKLVSLARKQSISLSFAQVYRTPTLKALAVALKRSWKRPSTVLPASKPGFAHPAVAPVPTKQLQAYVHKDSLSKHSDFPGSVFKTSERTKLESAVNGVVNSESKKTVTSNGISANGESAASHPKSKRDIAELWNIDAESIEDVSHCTPMQETLFASSQTLPGVQILQWEFQIPDDVSMQRVCDSWRRVVDRNPILRTRLLQSATSLLQVVLAEDFHWEVQHKAISDKARLRIRQQMMQNGGHLCDFVVFRAPNENVQILVWTVHHALVDSHAARLFTMAAHKGYKGHVIPHMEPLTEFYASKPANTIPADEEVSYWKGVLRGCQSSLFPGIPRLDDGVHVSAGLGQITKKLSSTITRHNSTALLRASWALTIAKMAKVDDVVFGALISDRVNARSRNVAGSLSNILPVRTKVNRAVSADKFLEQVHQDMTAMLPFERTSLSKIASIDPEFKRACEFQSVLNIEISRTEVGKSGLPGLNWMVPVDKPYWGSSRALVVDCFVNPHEIELVVRYEKSILEGVIGEILACFSGIVQSLASVALGTSLQDVLKTAASDSAADYVEAQLRNCLAPGEDCAVCVLKLQRAPDMLVVFLKVDENMTELTFSNRVSSLQHELKRKLPTHNIPSAFYRMPTRHAPEQPVAINGAASSPALPEWVLKQLDVDAKYIQDVSIATPFQTEIVGGMVQVPGAGTFIRRYPILPEMDINRLSKAWDLICAKLPCMRTRVILGPEHQSARLVTLTTWAKMDINSYESPPAAEAGINAIRIDAGSVGRALARAAVVHITGHQSVFIYAMNHTIYDRDTLDVMWDALCDAYWSGQVTRTLLPYRRLANYLDSIDPEPARVFWRSYLKDAPATVFPTNPTPDYVARPASSQGRLIPLVREGGSPITTGTLTRAAWGLTIGSYTGSNDVVFRGILSGRTVPVDEIERVCGPTLTNVPIRIRTTDPSTTVSSFLAKIQDDGADIVEHETLGLAAISGLSPEIGRVCGSFNNMLVVHPAEAASKAQAMPLGEESMVIDLTGYVALTLTCSLSATEVVASTIHDPKVLDDVAAQDVLARFHDYLVALADAEGRVDLTVGSLLQSLSERSKSPCAYN
ncbi:hypothetical protein F5Y12DRAFT_750743 [Xylaria sp. FL1777]|nr:hypothetical protein F5Y12DRAFT_750743 [Xylaria sp. FL1777]